MTATLEISRQSVFNTPVFTIFHASIPSFRFQYLTAVSDPTGGKDMGMDDLAYREG